MATPCHPGISGQSRNLSLLLLICSQMSHPASIWPTSINLQYLASAVNASKQYNVSRLWWNLGSIAVLTNQLPLRWWMAACCYLRQHLTTCIIVVSLVNPASNYPSSPSALHAYHVDNPWPSEIVMMFLAHSTSTAHQCKARGNWSVFVNLASLLNWLPFW